MANCEDWFPQNVNVVAGGATSVTIVTLMSVPLLSKIAVK